jgi:DHA2 family methylenomycin A resistance protein-like MFS transporter
MIAGAITAALGYGLLHFAQAASPLWTLLVPFLLIPSGMGLAVPAMTTAVLACVDVNRAGTASAVLNTARQAGGAVGVAAFGALASASASDAAGAAQVVAGLRSSTLISSCILLCALGLACLVHPEPHAHDRARAGRNAARPANASE